jgi:REase_AHJR-like
MNRPVTEREFLQNAISDLEHDGYEVFPQPKSPILPPFLKDFHPDIIARRGDKRLVVEVVSTLRQQDKSLAAMVSAVGSNPGWEMRVVVARPTNDSKPLHEQSLTAISQSADEVRALIDGGHYRAALLLGWSTFEALGRSYMPDDFLLAQSPGRLVQLLAQEGYVTPTEADALRTLAEKRNVLIHGNVLTEVSESDVDSFASILQKLIEFRSVTE